jgi:hypothetical protein
MPTRSFLPSWAIFSNLPNPRQSCLLSLLVSSFPPPLPTTQAAGAPQGNANAFTSQQWSLRVQRMMVQNSRGPGCFDFAYYVEVGGAAGLLVWWVLEALGGWVLGA